MNADYTDIAATLGLLTPLAQVLPPPWRMLHDHVRGTVLLLHPTGLHTYASDVYNFPAGPAQAIADALNAAVERGITGHVDVVTTRAEPVWTTHVEPVNRPEVLR
jgi:hypothetical protein